MISYLPPPCQPPKLTARKSIGAEENFPLCATVGLADDITSNNIVGYANNATEGVKQPMFGFTFTPVDGTMSITLKDVTATNMDPGLDYIQVIDPDSLVTTARYTYYSDAAALQEAKDNAETDPEEDPTAWAAEVEQLYQEYKAKIGWWTYGKVGTESVDAVPVAVGSGFLGLSPTKNNIKFTCNGEAPTKSTAYAPGKVKQPLIANFLPTDCCLKDITVDNMDPGLDYIQVIDSDSLVTLYRYTYYSDAAALQEAKDSAETDPEEDPAGYEAEVAQLYEENKAKIGWWTYGKVGTESADNVAVKASAGFLGLSPTKNDLRFNYKSCLDVTKPAAK